MIHFNEHVKCYFFWFKEIRIAINKWNWPKLMRTLDDWIRFNANNLKYWTNRLNWWLIRCLSHCKWSQVCRMVAKRQPVRNIFSWLLICFIWRDNSFWWRIQQQFWAFQPIQHTYPREPSPRFIAAKTYYRLMLGYLYVVCFPISLRDLSFPSAPFYCAFKSASRKPERSRFLSFSKRADCLFNDCSSSPYSFYPSVKTIRKDFKPMWGGLGSSAESNCGSLLFTNPYQHPAPVFTCITQKIFYLEINSCLNKSALLV